MTLRGYNGKPDSILGAASRFGPLCYIPVDNTAGIAAAQTPALNALILCNGLGVVNVPGSTTACILPVPIEPVITPAVNGDAFTITIVGRDQFGQPLTLVIPHAGGVVNQRAGATVGPKCLSRIDSMAMTAGALTGAITIGWKIAQTADGGAAANKQQRVPLPVRSPGLTDLIGVYVLDGGGGTFAAGAGIGAMLKAGVATFLVGDLAAPTTFFTYAPDPAVVHTRPIVLLPVFAPDIAGAAGGI